jgi:LysR family transcriptional regulator, transcriptional activator of the cysJI operon
VEDSRLKAFCLVVEMKSFSRAAEGILITQSAMSHLIKNLEDEIGVKLLNRSGKTVTPTPAGRLFYDNAKRILDQYKTMESSIHTLVNTIKGTLCIGASTTVASYLLPQVFYGFSRGYPDVRIDLTVSRTERIINYLYEGRIEAAIVEGNIKDSSVLSYEVAEDDIVIITSNDNPLTRRKVVTPHDLLSQPFIMPEPGSGIREFIDDLLRNLKIDPKEIRVLMTLGSTELIVQLVQSGMGISFVSKWSVFKALKDESVKLLNISNKKFKRKFYLVGMEKGPSTLVGKTFCDFLKRFKFFIPF